MGQPVVHFEIGCRDLEKSSAFFAEALAKIESLGGKTLVPPQVIPTGTFAWFSDPESNTFGLWKPA